MLLVSPEFKCSNEMLTIVAMISVQNVFMRPKDAAKAADEAKAQYAHEDSDHITLLNVYYHYKQSGATKEYCYENFLNFRSLQAADSVREQLARIMVKLKLPLLSTDYRYVERLPSVRRPL